MTISGNDENNIKKDEPKRSTISLKKVETSVSVGRKNSSSSSTVQVEVKRKKTSNLKLNIPNNSENVPVSSERLSAENTTKKDTSGKLTNQEFLTRVKVLQEAMKEDSRSSDDVPENTEVTVEADDGLIEVEEIVVELDVDEPIIETPARSESKAKFQPAKKKQNTVTGNSVVFKSSEYIAKPKATVSPKADVSSPVAPDVVVKPEGNKDALRFKKDIDLNNDEKRKTKPVKVFVKKAEAGKKVSRAVLHRVLDNDLEERTRSLASFKRAKQKLKNSGQQESVKVVREVNIPDLITVSELANRMAVRGAEVVKYLMKIGTMATLNQSIDGDTAEVICTEFGHIPKRVSESDVENEIEKIVDDPKSLLPRAPIVAIMGHVDHGKTTLLDTLRKTSVAAKEAGGITQHVAAYQIVADGGKKITFIDTPGHAAFSKIRSRGAVITDIIVLVVAADDGIKDQTIEAIAHAKSQNVPIVVAINKIDKPNVNVDRIKTDLMNHEIILEDFGGEVLSSEISALKNINLNGLIEIILLQAEMLQLKANPDRKAVGTIMESKMAKGKGIVASVIIQHGTMRPGDIFVAGGAYGKVRTIFDDSGKRLNSAGPSMPVEIVGFNNVPESGDSIIVMDSEQKAREIAEYRQRVQKDQSNASSALSIDQLMAGHNSNKQELNIVTKSDVYGSSEALVASINAINHDEIAVKVMDAGVGLINESDVDFAKNTGSMIIGFNVGITSSAKESAKQSGVRIYNNNVIYHIIEEIKKEMSKLLPPTIEERYIGNADVRKIFMISRYGTIAGCYVTDGVIKRNDSKIKVMRGNECIFSGKIRSMKHEKDELKESKQTHECGILAEGFNDFKEGDQIQCYEIIQTSRIVE